MPIQGASAAHPAECSCIPDPQSHWSRSWLIAGPVMLPGAPPPPGGSEVVDWITSSTRRGRTITAAIHPTDARCATVVVPDGDTAKTLADAALVEVLQAHTPAQPWWLGYLGTGVADLVAADAPKVAVYVGWPVTAAMHAGDWLLKLLQQGGGEGSIQRAGALGCGHGDVPLGCWVSGAGSGPRRTAPLIPVRASSRHLGANQAASPS